MLVRPMSEVGLTPVLQRGSAWDQGIYSDGTLSSCFESFLFGRRSSPSLTDLTGACPSMLTMDAALWPVTRRRNQFRHASGAGQLESNLMLAALMIGHHFSISAL
jgi:hypothetical protein